MKEGYNKMKCRVMLADDALFMRNYERTILEKDGDFEIVAEASNGEEAVKLYSKYKPDVVLMDITMPEMTGLDALKAIIALHPDANIIMCSAMGQKPMVLDAIKSGAKDFQVKPFKPAVLVESVKNARSNNKKKEEK